jgi:signal transduction histidine kinase
MRWPERSVGRRIAEAIQRIARLYAIETEARGQPPDERARIRQAKAKPILDDLALWLAEQQTRISGKTPLAAAIRYAITRLKRLRPYLDHGVLEIDNNTAERAMRVKFQVASLTNARSELERDFQSNRTDALEPLALAGIEAANVGLWKWNVASGSLVFTRKLEELLGCRPGEHITKFEDWKRKVDPTGGAIQERISLDFAAGRHDGRFIAEYFVDLPDGGRRYFVTRAGPLLDEQGQTVGLTGADTDITELRELTEELRRARDAAEAANRAKSAFLANMSHELRTPLNSIIGFSQVMEGQLLGPIGIEKYSTYATDVREAGEHLLSVINDILDISRIESGEVNLAPQIVSVADTLDAAIRFCQPAADKARVTLDEKLVQRDLLLYVDPRHFRQIVINLVSNAIRSSSAGGKIDFQATRESGDRVRICIIDTGAGIANDDLERVFEPFLQLSTSLSKQHPGTGLGLSIARSLAELHGGSLHLESQLGEGVKAVLILPWPDEKTA